MEEKTKGELEIVFEMAKQSADRQNEKESESKLSIDERIARLMQSTSYVFKMT
ncbi:MAG: hypothetical protein ABSE08_00925 [Syntrophobacteraceae bacterium]|jgi:hypothetical protein